MKNSRLQFAHFALFISRCSGSATLSYLLANALGLQYPVWASISSVVFSQVRLRDTQASVSGRIAGTIIGVFIALIVHALTSLFAIDISLEVAFAVAVCAAIAWVRPKVRVCMWTSLIVLLTANPSVHVIAAGFARGSEVIIGSLIGGALHFISEKIFTAVESTESAKTKHQPSLSDE